MSNTVKRLFNSGIESLSARARFHLRRAVVLRTFLSTSSTFLASPSTSSCLVSSSDTAPVSFVPVLFVKFFPLTAAHLGQAMKENPGYLKLRRIRAAQHIARTVSVFALILHCGQPLCLPRLILFGLQEVPRLSAPSTPVCFSVVFLLLFAATCVM